MNKIIKSIVAGLIAAIGMNAAIAADKPSTKVNGNSRESRTVESLDKINAIEPGLSEDDLRKQFPDFNYVGDFETVTCSQAGSSMFAYQTKKGERAYVFVCDHIVKSVR